MEIRNLDGDLIVQGKSGESVKDILKAETSTRVHTLRRKSFKRADLRNQDLESAKICASNDVNSSRRSDFMGSDFANAKLKDAEFVGLDLRAANFTGCDMRGVRFILCDMRGVCLDDVDMSGYTEDRTGHTSWISECVLDRAHASGSDFQEANMSLKSAAGAVFRNCDFEDAGFKGDWDDATFYCCNMEDTYPGSYGVQGARFGVHLSPDCNTTDMLLMNCSSRPMTLPEYHVETPDEAWDEFGFEVEVADDAFDERRESSRAEARKRMYAIAEKIMARDAARKAEMKAEREVVQRDRQQRVRQTATKVAALPPLSGEFESGLVSSGGGLYRKRITFNRPLSTGYATVRDQGFSVSGGRVTGARRVDRRSDRWELTIRSDGSGSGFISVVSTDALRGKGGRTLEKQVTTSITEE